MAQRAMSQTGLPKARHPGALFHMLLVPNWMPSPVLHFWFLYPHAEPVKGAVSFIFSALLNWLTVGVIHLPFKHSYPSAIHLEKSIVKRNEKSLQIRDGFVGLMGCPALSSEQSESRAGKQSSLQANAEFGILDCILFSISQIPSLESCLLAALEDFIILYSKPADVSGCMAAWGPESLLKSYKYWQSESIPVAIWKKINDDSCLYYVDHYWSELDSPTNVGSLCWKML